MSLQGQVRKKKKQQPCQHHCPHAPCFLPHAVIIFYLMTCPENCPWQTESNARERSSIYPAVRRNLIPGLPSFKALTLRVLLDQKQVQWGEESSLPGRTLKLSSQNQVHGLQTLPCNPRQLVTFFYALFYVAECLACMSYILAACMQSQQRPEEGDGFPGTGIRGSCEPQYVCLVEQPVLITPKLSFQLHFIFFF